jgi:sarcosine oxidase/L-pipecolate oxidase
MIAKRFPSINYPDKWGAAWDPSGGILVAHKCLNAVQSCFLKLGGNILTAQAIHIETQNDSSVKVVADMDAMGAIQSYSFDKAVICAGPWTSTLIPELEGFLSSVLVPVTYWHDPAKTYSVANRFPIIFNARLTNIYGLPSYEYPDQVKILFHGGPITIPQQRDETALKPYIEKVRKYVDRHFPLLDSSKPSIIESCMYTITTDKNPIIDRFSSNIIVGCGFSGSGFKHSPATGHMLASYAMEKEHLLPKGFRTDRYLFDRFIS